MPDLCFVSAVCLSRRRARALRRPCPRNSSHKRMMLQCLGEGTHPSTQAKGTLPHLECVAVSPLALHNLPQAVGEHEEDPD